MGQTPGGRGIDGSGADGRRHDGERCGWPRRPISNLVVPTSDPTYLLRYEQDLRVDSVVSVLLSGGEPLRSVAVPGRSGQNAKEEAAHRVTVGKGNISSSENRSRLIGVSLLFKKYDLLILLPPDAHRLTVLKFGLQECADSLDGPVVVSPTVLFAGAGKPSAIQIRVLPKPEGVSFSLVSKDLPTMQVSPDGKVTWPVPVRYARERFLPVNISVRHVPRASFPYTWTSSSVESAWTAFHDQRRRLPVQSVRASPQGAWAREARRFPRGVGMVNWRRNDPTPPPPRRLGRYPSRPRKISRRDHFMNSFCDNLPAVGSP